MASKTVLITGGAGYFGSHLTSELIRQNYRVFMTDISQLDVTYTKSILDYKKFVIEQTGTIDYLINNASIVDNNNLDEISINKILKVNFYGLLNMIKYFKDITNKSIINVSSRLGSIGNYEKANFATAYRLSKVMVNFITKKYSDELNINVNSYCPGYLQDSPLCKDIKNIVDWKPENVNKSVKSLIQLMTSDVNGKFLNNDLEEIPW